MSQGKKEFGPELWGIFGGYLFLLLCILIYVSLKDRRDGRKLFTEQHFLASRQMGPVVLGFSLCASMFSGYTVVGIPAEAFRTGFSALRWVGTCTFITLVYLAYAPRMQFLSRELGYDSLLAFARDRYNLAPFPSDCAGSNVEKQSMESAEAVEGQARTRKVRVLNVVLYWLLLVVLLIPCFVYLMVQFVALANTLNDLSDGVLSKPLVGILFAAMLVLYEGVGGLRVVSATDVLQGGLLLFCAFSILFYLAPVYGGLYAIVEELRQHPETEAHVVGGVADAGALALSWSEFWVAVGLQRALFPDYMQRAMAASDQRTLKRGVLVLLAAPFLIQVPFVFFGIAGKAEYREFNPRKANAIFAKVVLDVVDYNAFGAAVGSLMMVGCTAAIMSTADSVLIAVSHLVTLDVVRPFCPREAPAGDETVGKGGTAGVARAAGGTGVAAKLLRPERLAKVVAAVLVIACIPAASLSLNLSSMMQFQSLFLAQLFPLFVLGLYVPARRLSAAMIFAGLVAGLATGIPLLLDPEVKYAVMVSVACNLSTVVLASCALSLWKLVMAWMEVPASESDADAQCAARLQAFVAWKLPTVFKSEPVHSVLYWVSVVLPWFAIPFYRSYNGDEPLIFGTTPKWAFTAIVILVATHLTMVVVCQTSWEEAGKAGMPDPKELKAALPEGDVKANVADQPAA